MKCPGQDTKYWKQDAIYEVPCPECGAAVEFFKDDTARKCESCGFRFPNPRMDFGCAAYCKYADQCIGDLPPEALAQRADMLKDRVAVEMKRHFGRDFKRIGHATRVARYAERMAAETGGDTAVILMAAYLKDTGSPGDGAAGVAGDILKRLSAPAEMAERVRELIRITGDADQDRIKDNPEAAVLHDADLLASAEEQRKITENDTIRKGVHPRLLTKAGRKVAASVL